MVQVLNINLSEGTLIDNVNKTEGVNTTCEFHKRDTGVSLDFTATSEINGYGIREGVKTIEFWIFPTTNTKLFLDNGTDKLEIPGGSFAGVGMTECTINNQDTDIPTLNIWNQVIAEFSAGIDFSTDFEVDVTAITHLAGNIILHDVILTTDQKNESYIKFLRAGAKGENKRLFNYPKPSVDNDSGVVAHLTMNPVGNILVDISDNGNNGTIYNGSTTKDGIYFSASGDSNVNFGNVSDFNFGANQDFAFSFRFNPRAVRRHHTIISKGAHSGAFGGWDIELGRINNTIGVFIANGISYVMYNVALTDAVMQTNLIYTFTVSFDRDGNCISYLNAIQSKVIDISSWASDSLIGTFDAFVGKYPGSAGVDAEIQDLVVYNATRTLQQAKDYHNLFRKPILIDKLLYAGADGKVKIPIEWQNGTGLVKTDELSTYVNSDLIVGTDYIEFTQAGTMLYTGVDLDSFVNNGHISYWYYDTTVDGGTWEERTGLVDAPVTGVAYSDKTLTFTGANVGDRIANILLNNQIKV